MENVHTGRRLTVDTREGGGGMLEVPETQLDQVETLLNAHKFFHWVYDTQDSEDGFRCIRIVLGQRVDLALVQRLLDVFP